VRIVLYWCQHHRPMTASIQAHIILQRLLICHCIKIKLIHSMYSPLKSLSVHVTCPLASSLFLYKEHLVICHINGSLVNLFVLTYCCGCHTFCLQFNFNLTAVGPYLYKCVLFFSTVWQASKTDVTSKYCFKC